MKFLQQVFLFWNFLKYGRISTVWDESGCAHINIAVVHYRKKSWSGSWLEKIVAFPFISRRESRWSSCPWPLPPPGLSAWLRKIPILATWSTATGCQLPKASADMDRKTILCFLQASSAFPIFSWKACVRARPGVVAGPATRADWSGHTSVTSSAGGFL